MAQNTRKLVGVILMLAMLVAAIAALTVTTSAADTEKWVKTDIADIKSDDVVLITWTKSGKTYAVSNNKGTSYGPVPTEVTVTDDTINGAIADSLKWNITNVNGKLTIYPNGDTSKWLYCTATNNGVRVGTNANKSFVIDSSSGYLKNEATNRYLGVYNTQDVRCYTSSTATNIANQTLAFYVLQTDSSEPECTHANAKDVEAIAATCTTVGYTAGVHCPDCDTYTSGHEEIAALGHTGGTATCEKLAVCDTCDEEYGDLAAHNYENGACSVCGEEQPLEVTITFDDTSKRTTSTTDKQVWKENGITVTYEKNTYNNNLADYSNPIRFYAGTKVTIAYSDMTKIVVNANNATYATTLAGSVTDATATADGKVVTITLSGTVDSFSFVPTAQVRVDSIVVYYAKTDAPECAHSNKINVDAVDATCTQPGSTAGVKCNDCGEIISGCEEVAPSHTYKYNCSTNCEECDDGAREASCVNNTYACQDGECKYCGEAVEGLDHKFDGDYDRDCNYCGTTRKVTASVIGATISFADTTQRKSLSNDTQVWMNGALSLINNKGDSTTNIADYSNPVRFYKNSEVIISLSGMTTLVIDASGMNADYLWAATLDAAGASYTVADGVYTITFAEPVDSITLTAANQVRANSITASAPAPAEDESFVSFLGAGVRYAKADGSLEDPSLVSIRFGYKFANSDSVYAWGWIYAANGNELRTDGVLMLEDGTTNLVLTNIPTKFLGAAISVTLWYQTEENGEIIYDDVEVRITENVLSATALEGGEAADYAMAALYLYNKSEDYKATYEAWNDKRNGN